jgi:initiation factor 1A
MVKNVFGGSKTKSVARKDISGDRKNTKLRLAEDELELYACVTKMFGNGMCEIYTNDNKRYMGHIRNKFSGKQKRHNMIVPFCMVLVGLREWENPRKNCDIITIYDDSHVEQLSNIASINIRNLVSMMNTNSISGVGGGGDYERDDREIIFTDIEPSSSIPSKKELRETEEFIIEKMEDIDIDDI